MLGQQRDAQCPTLSHLWAEELTLVRNYFTITRVPCQAVSSSLHALTSHPVFIFPAKSTDRTWPGAPLSEAAMPRQALKISGLLEKAARVSRAPEGHPWLAGSSPPAPPPPLSPEPGQQETTVPFPQLSEWPVPSRRRESELC